VDDEYRIVKTVQPRDFSQRTKFPGNTGNSFDLFLGFADFLDKVPAILFAGVLGVIALLAARVDPYQALGLFGFFLGDWVVLALLPRAGKSFGPAKPPTFLLALCRVPFALLPFPLWIVVETIGTVLVVYGFWIEPHRLTLTRQVLKSPKLGFTRPLRVLHLGDIHVERLTNRERELLSLVESIAPDIILFSGDFLNLSYTQDALAQEHARAVLAELRAPYGVYVVSGSPAVDPHDVVEKLVSDMDNLVWLRDETALIEHEGKQIEIVGLNCSHRPFLDGANLTRTLTRAHPWERDGVCARQLNGADRERFRILLYHSPDLAPEAAHAGIDLQLSGHTHGGQVRLPFYGALYASSLYGKAFESGRRQVGDLTLYVTRGIGLEGGGAPRIRFNCPPEIVLWEIG
jgi:predicted MPP superfamily phosphohydrolase